MNKVCVLLLGIFFILHSLMPFSSHLELAKFPHLFEHYQEHKFKNQNLSFLDFLFLHYSNIEHQQSEDHHNLPKLSGNSIFSFFDIAFGSTFKTKISFFFQTHHAFYLNLYSFNSQVHFFQPPC